MARVNLKIRNAITGQPINVVDDEDRTFKEACRDHAPMDQPWKVFDEDGNDISDVKLKDFQGQAYIGPDNVQG